MSTEQWWVATYVSEADKPNSLYGEGWTWLKVFCLKPSEYPRQAMERFRLAEIYELQDI